MDILLAVSGGVDSMYMLHRAPELFPGASFAAAHCNFSLRGEESDGDEAFVSLWCKKHNIECFVRRFDTASEAATRGISIEMAARDLRYSWFSQICAGAAPELAGSRFSRFDAVATAHNANDCAETLILNMLRGCGTGGLRGIQTIRRDSDGLTVTRPLVETSREEILTWMEAHGYEWREDSTNADSQYKRNKIRNMVFPVFRDINPSFIKTLSEDMKHFAQADDIVEDYFRDVSSRIVAEDGSVDVHGLLECRHWSYVLWRLISCGGFSKPTFDKLTTLLERYRTEPRGTVTLGGKTFQSPTHELIIKQKRIYLYENENSRSDRSGSQR